MKQFKIIVVLAASILWSCSDNMGDKAKDFVELSKDAHSYANSNDIRMTHLSLDLEVNFESKTLSGSAKLDIENYTGGTQLILDTRKLAIQKIILDGGVQTEFTLGEESSIFGTPLNITVTPQTKNVTIFYTTSPDANALQWLSPEQTLGKVHPFLFSQSQAILARTWIPCQDGPGVKFTYDAKIKTDPSLIALMSAENSTEKSADGVYTFKMTQPISSYLLALTVGDLSYQSTGRNSGVFAEPDMLEKSVWELESMQSMIDSAETLYGPYAWEQYDVVILPPSFPFGGMENPRLTFATPTIIAGDRSLVALIAHELAHSWSGNLVTNETWNDFWLNEGFTVYFEQRIMEKIFGKPYEEMQTKLGMGDLLNTLQELEEDGRVEDTHLYLELDGRDPDDGLTDVAYEKGRFFLQTIEGITGRERFDIFLKEYFTKNKFKSMNTERFITYLNDNLLSEEEQKSLNAESWIYGPGLPDNAPETNSTELDRVELAIARFNNDRMEAKDIDAEGYTTHHWLYFLRGLKNLNLDKMESLDKSFDFTNTGNSEIACDWFKHCIEQSYKPAYPAMDNFLVRVGRRKFLTPLYSLLAKTSENKEWALEVYKRARSGYHSVSYNTIDEVLK
ncbi:MAG: aminopeptidase [Bacteroidetes bacterium]|nr:MAG: aminopeptidase [Bacteroidota bacterium]